MKMNLSNHPGWTVQHEARFQTLLGYESLLNEIRSALVEQKESEDPYDLLNHKRSAEQILEALLRDVVPTQGALLTANAMEDKS